MAKKIDITEEDYAMLMPTGNRILVKVVTKEKNAISNLCIGMPNNKIDRLVYVIAVGDDEKFTDGKSRLPPDVKFILSKRAMFLSVTFC